MAPPATWAWVACGIAAIMLVGVVPLRAQDGVRPVSAVASSESAITPNEVNALLPAGLDAATRAALVPVFHRARTQGLPLSELSTKAAEGVLRHASSEKIVSAVTALQGRMVIAKAALAPAEGAEIVAGADALSYGISPDVLRDIRSRRPKTTVAIPISVLTELVAEGVPMARASSIVLRLLERGASAPQLAALPQLVSDDIANGRPAIAALDSRAASVLSALGARPSTPPSTAASATTALTASGGHH